MEVSSIFIRSDVFPRSTKVSRKLNHCHTATTWEQNVAKKMRGAKTIKKRGRFLDPPGGPNVSVFYLKGSGGPKNGSVWRPPFLSPCSTPGPLCPDWGRDFLFHRPCGARFLVPSRQMRSAPFVTRAVDEIAAPTCNSRHSGRQAH